MQDPHEFLRALTIVLCVAAVTTVVFQRLRQPVILGYILAGLLIGPHLSLPLVADSSVVRTLSEVGVILLMFSLGLEFSLRKLVQVGPTAAGTAVVETSLMMWLGFTVAQAFGWSPIESLFTGAIVAISSTTIVAKAFQEQRVIGRLREMVVGVLIVEDLIAILLLATLTAIATGSGLEAGPLAMTVGKLAAFLVALVGIGVIVVPRVMRLIIRLNRPETTIVASIGICFALALLADRFGYSVALGAFIAGSLIAESGEEKQVEQLVEPVRDIFAAVFFVSVGMLIDPTLIWQHWPAVVVLTAVVVIGKIVGVSLGSFLTGNPLRISIQSGMSLAQIGEFSFIIAGLGLTLQATGSFLYPVAIAISALTTLTTPWLVRASGPVASWVDRQLPQPLQTFTVLYGSWIEGLRNAPRAQSTVAQLRRLVRRLLLDAALFAGIVVGIITARGRLLAFARDGLGIPETVAYFALIALALALATPFFLGVIRIGRKLGLTLAELVLPASGEGKVDLAAAPRRLLVVTFELVMVILVGAPLLALTRPFL
ncbi:MAG: cation:proton antiporter, partial [Desulfuromonadales bacterium]|nr:cation:proton antiporter [Desulfuromonadales bacterium]